MALTNDELEDIVASIAKHQNAMDVVILIKNQEGLVEICSAHQQVMDQAEGRKYLADMLVKVAEEVESGGGMPVGRDGERY